MTSKYHIVYPSGDRRKLSVVEIVPALDYELNDYAVASRQSFDNREEAMDYARSLAWQNDKEFVDNDEGYLD